ncbi:MAG TPA: NAD-dependent epimerase/dehydratase family protein [Solirubrobacteraceae bacterium]|nr:NAD-dependent epimerase/dehydratase family protein [Solirubrobacteraceae bacterium]
MKVLVTGGAGFIGSHVVDKLIAAGIRPRVLDMVPSPYHSVEDVDTRIGDLTDPQAMLDAAEGCDAILHLAAVADVNEVTLDPAFAEEVNAHGTLNVLEAARTLGVGRVVYASTIWVYNGCAEEEVDESSQLGLASHVYTATKVAGEMYCTSYAELYGLEYTILRFGIPYGPRARPAAVVPQFVRKALAGEPLTIAGKGEQTRRFVYVEDLADGVVAGLAPAARNRVFNLVGEEDTSVLEIAQVVRSLVGDVDIVHTEARLGDFRGVRVRGDRAAEELGWRASTRFAEGVGRYLDWYRTTHEESPAVDSVG